MTESVAARPAGVLQTKLLKIPVTRMAQWTSKARKNVPPRLIIFGATGVYISQPSVSTTLIMGCRI